MTVKDSIKNVLETNVGNFVSGGKLAEELGVTRQYVSILVSEMEKEGYDITSKSRLGYRLNALPDILSENTISRLTGCRVYYVKNVTSTNDFAIEKSWIAGDRITVSDEQITGRKKDGGDFPSPEGAGIYATITKHPEIGVSKIDEYRAACAEVVRKVLEDACGEKAETRDTDDIYMGGKKICGMLTECLFAPSSLTVGAVFVGIGIYTKEVPESSMERIRTGKVRNEIIADIYNGISAISL
ncbi:MAG: HTH domain-containing protein [Clostridia bacterium]|nr:HTH domain-containing protein [Clostridia bacterium]